MSDRDLTMLVLFGCVIGAVFDIPLVTGILVLIVLIRHYWPRGEKKVSKPQTMQNPKLDVKVYQCPNCGFTAAWSQWIEIDPVDGSKKS